MNIVTVAHTFDAWTQLALQVFLLQVLWRYIHVTGTGNQIVCNCDVKKQVVCRKEIIDLVATKK